MVDPKIIEGDFYSEEGVGDEGAWALKCQRLKIEGVDAGIGVDECQRHFRYNPITNEFGTDGGLNRFSSPTAARHALLGIPKQVRDLLMVLPVSSALCTITPNAVFAASSLNSDR